MMVTGQTAKTNQIHEFLSGRILTLHDPQLHQHQNLSTQVSTENILPMFEQTQRNQNSDSNNSADRPAEAIAGIATQPGPQADTMPEPVSKHIEFSR